MQPAARAKLRIALMLDPRFPGGTPASVAAAVRALAGAVDLTVVAVESRMFSGRKVNPRLRAALDERGLDLVWNPPVVHADVAVFHNPACLKFDRRLPIRISCGHALVVAHENFLRPNGSEGFDVAGCLRLIDASLVAGGRSIVPISPWNRRGVEAWAEERDWPVAGFDWPNICDFEAGAPNPAPRDRRGRHSRPGLEKFPPMATMLAHFPRHAESCTILGGDSFLARPDGVPAHWRLLPFGAMAVASFLEEIDFFVYFTNPQWRESFGRAIAEAIAAGKLVITDPGTAEVFGDAAVASDGTDVDAIIEGYVREPRRYVDFVEAAQRSLERFRPAAVAGRLLRELERVGGRHAAV
jgi:hypothetical protein